MNKLVSIISPCYNGEGYVRNFLNSVLAQTYDYIELIMINDGSTDGTSDILHGYENNFAKRKYRYIVIDQENAGQSEAINKGLRIFTGEYMSWLDSDDTLPAHAIETKVNYMESHPKVGLCVCKVKVVDFDTHKEIGEQKRIPPLGNDNLFRDLIIGDNVFYTPGGYMVRSKSFRAAMPHPLQIRHPREIGQNFQLLLPIAYRHTVGYIDDYLYYYSVRQNSHSHERHTYEEQMRIINEISRSVLYGIANDIEKDSAKLKEIINLVDIRLAKYSIMTLYSYGRKDNLDDYVAILQLHNYLTKDLSRMVSYIKHPLFRKVVSIKRRIMKHIK